MIPSRAIFPAFLLITLVTYFPTLGAGFVYDFLGWQRVYNEGSFGDILHCFGYKGNHQVLHFFFYSIYSLFHIQGLPWYLIFCSLHALNGWLLYSWMMDVSDRWNIRMPVWLAAMACVLFLVNPNSVESVVWKVCLHYLLSLMAVLGVLILYPKFVLDGKRNYLWWTFATYASSLFLLEISFVTPLVITLLLAAHGVAFQVHKSYVRRAAGLAGGLWGLLFLYLLLNRLTLGAWVGHYGADVHLSIDLLGMMANEVKYLAKHLIYARFYSFETKHLLFDQILSSREFVFFILTAFLILMWIYILKIRNLHGAWHLVFWGVVVSMVYVLPVSNLFFYHLHIGMNDRFSYLPLVFLIVAGAALLSRCPRRISLPILTCLLLLNLVLQQKTIWYWHHSTEVLQSLKASYRWQDRSHVFILNSPDNYKGIVMASIYAEPSGIDELIDYQTPKPNPGITYDVFQFNMTSPDDGVTVEQTGPMQLKVTFSQWGNWWHRDGMGASTYENEYYTAEMLGHPYLLTFKQLPEGSAIIYQDRKVWKEFTFEENQ